MTTRTRFAPSPTGRLHVGNIRTALHNWLLARQRGGEFLLRIDDTDSARSEDRYITSIRQDLAWLGLSPDGEERQSDRLDHYEAAFARLQEAGRLYPCYETSQELELKRKILLGRGKPPIYDRAALSLSAGQRAEKEAQGISPHWRFLLDHDEAIEWEDGIRGAQKFDPAQLSDPVVRRADGSWLYMLPSAVDDIAMNITDILRGEDHVSNTAVQIQMFTALDAAPPAFAHEALLVGSEGKLSKRLGALGCESFHERGIEPEALIALLARIGTALPIEPIAARQTLVNTFDLSSFSRAPARFDDAELERLNTAIIHQLTFADVQNRLPAGLPEGLDETAWNTLRPNLIVLSDIYSWWEVVTGPVTGPEFDEDTRQFLKQAVQELDWSSADPWHELTNRLKASTGRKGKSLFLPLRQALTGMDHGPDMKDLLPLIGEGEARRRLASAAST
ncbi:MAG: glutamate--tRNA ligase [Sphingomonadaceae bacterium]